MRQSPGIALDPRLSLIAELVGRCDCCADIGCDHGRLGAFILQNGWCHRAVLTDISEASLMKARRLIDLLGLSDSVQFRVGDGALALPEPVPVAVIAGMGGTTIARIVRDGLPLLRDARLVLQPNVAAPELREALSACGFAITDERVAQDGRRNYIVIQAEPGPSEYDPRELEVGPVLLKRMPPELLPYAKFRLRVAQKALAGAEASGDEAQIGPPRRQLEIWREVCACLQP